MYASQNRSGWLSSLRTLIIDQDYSTASDLLSPNTCRGVFDERVFAHRRRNLRTPHQDSRTCVFNVAVSQESWSWKAVLRRDKTPARANTHPNTHCNHHPANVCEIDDSVFFLSSPPERGMKSMSFAEEGNSEVVSKQPKQDFTICP